jgi:hypothetical protein
MIITVEQGQHKFKPGTGQLLPARNRQRLQGRARFGASCFYDQQYIDDEPYDGQNKLIGLQFHLTKKHENDAMISWACKQGLIGVGPYWHVEGSSGQWWKAPMIIVGIEQWFDWKIEASIIKNTVDIFLKTNGMDWIRSRKEMPVGCWSWVLPPWFGGQLPASRYMTMEIDIFK